MGFVKPNAGEVHKGFCGAGWVDEHGTKKFVKLPGGAPNPAIGMNGAWKLS